MFGQKPILNQPTGSLAMQQLTKLKSDLGANQEEDNYDLENEYKFLPILYFFILAKRDSNILDKEYYAALEELALVIRRLKLDTLTFLSSKLNRYEHALNLHKRGIDGVSKEPLYYLAKIINAITNNDYLNLADSKQFYALSKQLIACGKTKIAKAIKLTENIKTLINAIDTENTVNNQTLSSALDFYAVKYAKATLTHSRIDIVKAFKILDKETCEAHPSLNKAELQTLVLLYLRASYTNKPGKLNSILEKWLALSLGITDAEYRQARKKRGLLTNRDADPVLSVIINTLENRDHPYNLLVAEKPSDKGTHKQRIEAAFKEIDNNAKHYHFHKLFDKEEAKNFSNKKFSEIAELLKEALPQKNRQLGPLRSDSF
jgi:hypothetical protein